ncbi:hypothetical protein ASPZODRAFT_54971 [Penicilliopsis zonata CBS 506.65]|uniref:Zn(2)-C6 fungal-type domain-containing protein n=1 Tax=Penicilliopsis zonata CBS 506.65 TaxID=1073090 RepID=A0A1L9SU77_9EURO|nr:hypothetical protein ASPZODRAFT_54971 [Penicilliopsis zonata CBS 506.65]OJJ50765.1 hypothetical protein ASPZODRAFT_54971 [Penicilliopsis zonata CBS 506.65]
MNPSRHPQLKPAAGVPAPYGRACSNCSRAKCKCILLAGSSTECERCHRLNKECRPSATVRKAGTKRSSASKTSQLEAKLDSLVSMLQLSGSGPPLPAEWSSKNNNEQHGSNSHRFPREADQRPDVATSSLLSPSATNSHPHTSSNSPGPVGTCLPPDEAEEYLDHFRSNKLKFFPLIHIPPEMTAHQLWENKPFVWLNIMQVSARTLAQQETLRSQVKYKIYEKLLVENERSMDMLLGLLIALAWSHCRDSIPVGPFYSLYVHMTMGIVGDLGLNKPPRREIPPLAKFKQSIGYKPCATMVRTSEQRRAVLACYICSSCLAICIQKSEPLQWTPHMDESLRMLSESPECLGDEILVVITRLHLIMDKVGRIVRDGENDYTAGPFYLQALRTELNVVKGKVPTYLQQDGKQACLFLKSSETVLPYVQSTEFIIHEVSFSIPPLLAKSPDLQRLDSLCTALHTIKSWFDHWLTIFPSQRRALSLLHYFQFSRALINLYRLSTLNNPAWDKNLARNTANLVDILNRMIHDVEQTAAQMSLDQSDGDAELLSKLLKMLYSFKQGWEPTLVEGMVHESLPANPLLADTLWLDNLDDSWIMGFLSSL